MRILGFRVFSNVKLFVTKLFALFAMVFVFSHSALAQTSDLDYLPKAQNYDNSIPKPAEVLGYPVGTWHVRHDQLVAYMKVLAEASDRISIQETGRTHEQRPLLLLTITAPKNHKNIAQIKQQHISRIETGEAAKGDDPLVIYMGYSVHGNEPSGSNASLLVAYHLAASNSPEVLELLNNNVVLLDPSLNPDGLARFAQWANMHKSKNLVTDPMNREHREYWPSGRTNHYWFDLNRDWLLLTHPESKARIAQFHAWRPHILTDFHEMGTDSTFFFQPGVPSRKNPWTPSQNVTLTGALAKFHAAALDQNKELYFTEESFDDFYYGKGSTYPDAHGSIGILFEQASSRGHAQESINGVVTFPRSIQNQVSTSLSTFKGALANKAAILDFQKQFYRDTKELIDEDKTTGYLISAGKDSTSFNRMVSILQSHQIEVQLLTKQVEVDKQTFMANKSAYVTLDQNQYRLIKSLFSERKRFTDNTFYDVSNWNIALAFNKNYAPIKSNIARRLSLKDFTPIDNAPSQLTESYAYAFEWHDAAAPRLLNYLLSNDVQARIAGADFTAQTSKGERQFSKGAVMIPTGLKQPEDLIELLQTMSQNLDIPVYNIQSGLTSRGIDLGSRTFAVVEKPEVLLVGGVGTSSYEVGEIWHYLDTRVGIPATIWDANAINLRSLDRYTHIIFASGRYSSISDKGLEKISEWVKKGGVLIGQKTALRWFAENDWLKNDVLSRESVDKAFDTSKLAFGDQSALRAKKLVAGAVYQSKIDLTHPLFFGFENEQLPTFKTNNLILKATDDPFSDIGKYTESPLIAGYSADEMQALIKNSTSFTVNNIGQGSVVAFVDNVHFRGYWDGTNKLTSNAIFMKNLF